MDIKDGLIIAQWLENVWEQYLRYLQDGNARAEYSGLHSGDWESGELIRVSKVASECPKYAAASASGFIDKRSFPFNKLVQFEDATRRAEQIYEAISWAADSNNIAFDAERRIIKEEIGLAGTIDGCIVVKGHYIPIEVKMTNANHIKSSPEGISPSHFIQTIGEMELLRDGEYICPFGFVFTTYSADSTPVCKVWTVEWDNSYQGWFLRDSSKRIRTDNEAWPTLPTSEIFLSRDEYFEMVKTHKEWMNASSDTIFSEERPYLDFKDHWQCGKLVKPYEYKSTTRWGNKGEMKPHTGSFHIGCPLFGYCFSSNLEEAGYTKESYPEELPMEWDTENNVIGVKKWT